MTGTNGTIARRKEILTRRARIVQAIRAFFIGHYFLEVETPHRISANAPEPYIDAISSGDMWLQTSPELAMKRLLAAGYGNIFQICRVWRDAERGRLHLPEFTMLEWYRPYTDYHQLMDDCEALISHLLPAGKLSYQGKTIDLNRPWPRLTVTDAFARFASCPVTEALRSNRFEEILTEEVEPALGLNPLFLTEYPAELAALARTKHGDHSVAERCELYIGGIELANGFSELVDPVEQGKRFTADEATRRQAGKPPYPPPEKFLSDLKQMPESAGIALGLDRLVMLLADAATIDAVVALSPDDLD